MAIGLFTLVMHGVAHADCQWVESAHLTPPDDYSFFGMSVAISGDTMIVGAPFTAGVTYIYVWNGSSWVHQATLMASGGLSDDSFGVSVAIDGDTAVIGEPFDAGIAGHDQGSAYVFCREGSTWTLRTKLIASDADQEDEFGYSVAVAGDLVVVGAYEDDGPAGENQGSAYVFVQNGGAWIQEAKLTSDDAHSWDLFGCSVGASADTVIVGAYRASVGSTGSAYIFVQNGGMWTQQAELFDIDPQQYDEFGWSVAISGDTVIVGSPLDGKSIGKNRGAAFVYVRNGSSWTLQHRFTAVEPGVEESYAFGTAVDISGDMVVVGAPGYLYPYWTDGFAYVFRRMNGEWVEQYSITSLDSDVGDLYGAAVATNGFLAVASAPQDECGLFNYKGSLYVFSPAGQLSADLDGDGVIDLNDLAVVLASWGVPPTTSDCGEVTISPADLNCDGVVNTLDLGILLSSWTL